MERIRIDAWQFTTLASEYINPFTYLKSSAKCVEYVGTGVPFDFSYKSDTRQLLTSRSIYVRQVAILWSYVWLGKFPAMTEMMC